MLSSAEEILQHTFGFPSFRDRQKEIVEAVVAGANALVVMPTGGGKSLCYQVPSLVREGMGVVVSPLIALMQDQVNALKDVGVRAAFLNSSLEKTQLDGIESAVARGEIEILYIAPERLIQVRTLDLLAGVNVSLFAIDEAHCVAQWGHDFRADYLRLDVLVGAFPNVPRVALTATADSKTQNEIAERLSLDNSARFICGFDRENIEYRIRQKNNPRKQLMQFLQSEYADQAGIVYCLSRNKVDDTAIWLKDKGFNALPYHAGMSSRERQINQNRFLREEGIIIVATIAFGMGIDKPNVRFVVHLDMPKSIEAYYQETGRAGRDGDASTAVLFYGMEDVVKLTQMLANSQGNDQFVMYERQRLNAMLGLCEMTDCRRRALLRYFGELLEQPCGNCDNCLNPPETWDATDAVRKALSCVYRTGQRFGVGHVVDVLRGADNDKVRQFSHSELSTYGIGKDLSVDAWRSVFRQLLVLGYLDIDPRGYGNLILSEKCRPVLKGEQPVRLSKEIHSKVKAGSGSSPRKKQKPAFDLNEDDQSLWNALRSLRKRLADEANVPPYVVFSDASLQEMAVKRPRDDEEFLCVSGVGDKKLERYGEAFLDVIREREFG